MKMNLTYRDKMILIVVGIIAALAVGIFVFIKPKYEDIKANNDTLTAVKAEWDGLDKKIAEIPDLEEKIITMQNDSKKLSDDFYLEHMETYEFDQFMQKVIDKVRPVADQTQFKITKLELGEATNENLSYYYYTPEIPRTAIFDLADMNGNYQKEINDILEESNAISQRQEEEVLCQQYGVTVNTTQECLWQIMDEVNELDKSIIINSVIIEDPGFGFDVEKNVFKEEAILTKDSTGQTVGFSEVTMVISVYSVFEIDPLVIETE